MKVYIITREPFPNGMAATNRIKCYAKALIQEGVQCKVLIFIRTENKGTIIKNIEGKGVFEGIEVNIPNKVESLLTKFYGDYMTPPKDTSDYTCCFTAFDFGHGGKNE